MAWADKVLWVFAEPKGTDDDPIWSFGEAKFRIDTTAGGVVAIPLYTGGFAGINRLNRRGWKN